MKPLLAGRGRRRGAGDNRERGGAPDWRVQLLNLLLAVLLMAGGLALFPPVKPSPHFDYKLGDVTQTGESVIAPISFPVPVDPEQLDDQRAAASLAVPPVYRFDDAIARQIGLKLDKLGEDARATQPLDSLETLDQRVDRLLGLHPGLERAALRVLLERGEASRLLDRVREAADTLLAGGILDTRRPLATGSQGGERLTLLWPGGERMVEAARVTDQEELGQVLERMAREVRGWDIELRSAFRGLARAHLRPNAFYDAEETASRKQAVAGAVPTETIVAKGVRVLGPNVQVTQDHLDQLAALESALGLQSLDPWRIFVLFAGKVLLLAFMIALATRFLLLYRADFFHDSRRTLFLVILLLVFLGASRLVLATGPGGEYLLPITFVAMIVAGLYDGALAMLTSVLALSLLGVVAQPPLAGILVGLLAAGAGIFSIAQIRNRLQLYKSVLFVCGAYFLGVAAVHLGDGVFAAIVPDVLKGMANGLVCAWLVTPILPLLERFFDLTTNFTLLELTDLNRPLMKRLKVEAPGTFQHSLAVSNLAEAAADAIGANALLAKVCAYYHDIGKLKKPEYFAENQRSGRNRHDKLSPSMSALIIGAHVKDGLEMSEQVALPSIVRSGIPEHHGTTVMQYFYRKALERDPHGKVRDDDFRYPGPRPQSPETAILMLADTVEATARALDSPSTSKIRSVVTEAVERRLREGELEACGLSIRDLARIRESFIVTLLSIYHPRIQYPAERETGSATARETAPAPVAAGAGREESAPSEAETGGARPEAAAGEEDGSHAADRPERSPAS
ncbi:MAG: HDIG domain-containing protein [Candidatus Krumholzibacteriota bacterium]|nr:HDIG domain-containing protein [Candidatus Krumholzibacteriota bacterium]